jgi:hypothetical protein
LFELHGKDDRMLTAIVDDVLQSLQVSDLKGGLIINYPRNLLRQLADLHISPVLDQHGLHSLLLDDHAFNQFLHLFVQF